ncbi:sulfatase [bacterium]|nr:sulfatase [bacterium]
MRSSSLILLCSSLSVLLTCLIVIGCFSEKPDTNLLSFVATFDIVQSLGTNFQNETLEIDFSKEGHPEPYLLNGWGEPEDTFIWANGLRSRILFHGYNTRADVRVEVHCSLPLVTIPKDQDVVVYVNDNQCSRFRIEPGQDEIIQFTIPAIFLRSGVNFLEFQFTYTMRFPNTEKKMTGTMKFKKIVFQTTNSLTYGADSGLIQKSPSTFCLYGQLPTCFRFEIQYTNILGASSRIDIIREDNNRESIELPQEGTRYVQIFQMPRQEVCKLCFSSEGSADSSTLWKKIQISTPISTGNGPVITPGPALPKNNIVLYVIDTLRNDHLGCYGYDRKTSPHMDRFARHSALYQYAYAPSSWTRPSAASIVTGLLPHNHRATVRSAVLSSEFTTLAEVLKNNGYYTVAFISNSNIVKEFGFDQGFDEFHEFLDKEPITYAPTDSHVVGHAFDEFLAKYRTSQNQKPLFILVWTVDPHAPYTPDKSVRDLLDIDQYTEIDTYDWALIPLYQEGAMAPTDSQLEFIKTRYDQEIVFNDQAFGRLLDTLRAQSLYENTTIIVTSDHGEEFLDHDGYSHGTTLYNEVITIPFMIKSDALEPGIKHDRIQLIDLFPTVLDLNGIQHTHTIDGVSLLKHESLLQNRVMFLEEQLDHNDLTALFDSERKMIFNRYYHHPPFNKNRPIIELYSMDDHLERRPLKRTGFEAELRLQELLHFYLSRDSHEVETLDFSLHPELDQQLNELGYMYK